MKKILVISNSIKENGNNLGDKCAEYISARGYQCVRGDFPDGIGSFNQLITEDTEFIIILGGDGTILRVAGELSDRKIPMLGINLGTVGFLAEAEPSNMEESIDRLLTGDYKLEDRMMLKGEIECHGEKTGVTPALNDISITRYGSMRMVRFKISVNGEYLCSLSADGILLSTPTGSTAYNMSAGGPIIAPEASMILITPICSHNFRLKSIVLGSGDRIEIEVEAAGDGSTSEAEVNSDGRGRLLVKTGDRITVTKSDSTCKLVKLNNDSFVEKLQQKMDI